MAELSVEQNRVAEWALTAVGDYADPFHDVQLDAVVTDPEGEQLRVPAFWAGDGTWRIRYASARPGTHRWRTECSNAQDAGLHGIEGRIEVQPSGADNPLLRHGPVGVSEDRRYLAHADGTPFLWLADTWWMGLCRRLHWPDEFDELLADRVAKGFSVIQIVAGLYPDMAAFDQRGANDAGFPWEPDWARVNPAYFDAADRRIRRIVEAGVVPCIVACWGYYLRWLGAELMKAHWRYLVARWAAYPVVWCLAGEATMPFYLSEDRDADAALLKEGWTELARYVRGTDPFRRPVTIHPTSRGRDQVSDPALLDFDMLQTGHGDRDSLANTVRLVTESRPAEPTMPVINGEVCYEGIGGCCREQVQRLMFWVCMLSGAAGHTYGANGIWQVNREDEPYGPSPHGMSWGHTPWREAYRLPGSRQLGAGKRLLERYEWWRFEPHPEWVEPHWTEGDFHRPYAAGIPGKVRIVFLPFFHPGAKLTALEAGSRYRAFFLDPAAGTEHDLGAVTPDPDGNWSVPPLPIYQDWLVVLERTRA
jgi:hypothetical protein